VRHPNGLALTQVPEGSGNRIRLVSGIAVPVAAPPVLAGVVRVARIVSATGW